MKFYGNNWAELNALIRASGVSPELAETVQTLAFGMAVSALEYPEDVWDAVDTFGEPVPGYALRTKLLDSGTKDLPETDVATGPICPLTPAEYGLALETWPGEWDEWDKSAAIGGPSRDGATRVIDWLAAKSYAAWVAWKVAAASAGVSMSLLTEWEKVKRWRYSAGRER